MATTVDGPQTAAAPKVRRRRSAKGAVKSACKRTWTQMGALAGFAVGAADLLLGWRGAKFEAFDDIAGLAHNLTRLGLTVLLAAFLGFIAGAIRDAVDDAAPRNAGTPRNARAPRNARSRRKHRGPKTPQPADLRHANVLALHWRGELPFWVSCWIVGVIGGLAVSFAPAIAVAAFKADNSYSPVAILSVSAAVWSSVFAVAVWQGVGVWRSATRYVAERLDRPARSQNAEFVPLWGWLARFAVVIGLASLVATFGTEWLPQLTELGRIALYDDPDIPAYSIRVNSEGTEAEIAGGFKYGLTNDFTAALNTAPYLKIIHLDSEGGRLGEAERLFTLIRERGLSTYVSSKCFSACTLAFAGGRQRILRRGAALGFHKAEFPGVSENEFDSLQERVFSAAGFDSRFIDRALATPHKDLWTPPPDVLLAARVITSLTDGKKAGSLSPAENAAQPRRLLASTSK